MGINAANNVACLDALRKNAQLQQAIKIRQAARLLGVPPMPRAEDEELLAGGNITFERPAPAWPWAVAIVAVFLMGLALAGLGAALWLGPDRSGPVVVGRPDPPSTPRTQPGRWEIYTP